LGDALSFISNINLHWSFSRIDLCPFLSPLNFSKCKLLQFLKVRSSGAFFNKINLQLAIYILNVLYYYIVKKFAEVEQIKNFNGFGLYDKKFIEVLRKFDDPYPYFRGMVSEVGFSRAEITYTQAERKRGTSNNNFYALYDTAMLGFVSHSKLPLRLASFIGFSASLISFLLGIIYLIYKLIFWNNFELGLAPLVVGLFFFASIQLFFIGIIGEYIGMIYTRVKKRPLVIEEERINF